MFYHAAGCTISEEAAGDDDGPSKPTKSAMPTEGATPSARARGRGARRAGDLLAKNGFYTDYTRRLPSARSSTASETSC